ncbi:MAG TPA: phage major capsid protein, partial [Beutenbergiaceae bacterium]|nr:phage major capsid protein [Beutenbergiaceae bacterium]
SREQYKQAGTSSELARSVQRSVIKKADALFITNATAPTGITEVVGLEDGGEVTDSLDALIDLVATVEANGSNPSGILLSPKAWAEIRQLKTAEGSNASLVGAGVDDAAPYLLGLPLTVTAALTGTEGLIIDRSAVVAAAGAVLVARSEHRYFDTDSIGLRASWRIGWNITRPNRIGKFTVATE